MTVIPDEELLLRLANAIDDEQPVNWQAAEESASEQARAVVGELRVLDDMARVARSPDHDVRTNSSREPVSPSSAPSEQPSRTWGPLSVFEQIGGGAFGTVFRARDSLSRDVALKLFKDPEDSSRLVHEGRLLGRVSHNNVIVVYGAGEFDGEVGLWMELVRGRTLEQELKVRGSFSAEEARLIGLDVCRALAAVHEAGLVHRDVKAQNVMRAQGGRIVLMDFGTGAEQFASSSVQDIAGTPAYLAPEVFAGRPASRQSDIYALGVLLFHLATGSYPIPGSTRAEIEIAHVKGRTRRLRDSRPDLPEGFVRVVERCLSADPRQRYQTAGELEHALVAQTGTEFVPAPRPKPVWQRRAALSAAVVSTLLVGWLIYTIVGGDTHTPVSDTLTSTVAKPSVTDSSYQIKATFLKFSHRQHVPVAQGGRVAPGDELAIRIQASTDAYVYVVNEDDQGESYLLFPLPGQELTNPLTAGDSYELPGTRAGREAHWQVTSPGRHEHFVVYVSPTHLPVFDEALRSIPPATADRPITHARLPESVVTHLRGVGGLVSVAQGSGPSSAHYLFEGVAPIGANTDTAHGVWARQLTLANPGS